MGRKILDWAVKSGLRAPKQHGPKASNDKPDMTFQIRELDDASMRRAVYMVAPMQQRNYVVMEVRGNLLKSEREELVKRFDRPHFKKVAKVLLGDPDAAFKKKTHELLLQDKQAASDRKFNAEKAEEKRKKQAEKKQKELAKVKKTAEKAKAKAAADAKKRVEEIKKKAAAEKAKAEAKKEGKEEEKKEEEEKAEESEESEAEVEEEVKDEPAPKVTLDADEKKNFRVKGIHDLTARSMSSSFTKFTIPEKEEGFDEIQCEWTKTSTKCQEFMKNWVLDKKATTRIEELVPGQWFHQRVGDMKAAVKLWHGKVDARKAAVAKKAATKAAKEAKKRAAVLKAAKDKEEAEKKAAAAAAAAEKAKAEGKEVEEKKEEKKEDEKPAEEEKEEEEEEEEPI